MIVDQRLGKTSSQADPLPGHSISGLPLPGHPIPGQIMKYSLTLTNILRHARRGRSDQVISTKSGSGEIQKYSYREFYRRVCKLAHAERFLKSI
jgi:hypothetical protein